MEASQYWVGQIPARPLAIEVNDTDGDSVNLSTYTEFNVIILGSDNEEVDLDGSELATAGASEGRFVFRWPVGRSVFNKAGIYLLQLELKGPNVRDLTTVHNIKVKKLGGNK